MLHIPDAPAREHAGCTAESIHSATPVGLTSCQYFAGSPFWQCRLDWPTACLARSCMQLPARWRLAGASG